jgi:hypothetical protein
LIEQLAEGIEQCQAVDGFGPWLDLHDPAGRQKK